MKEFSVFILSYALRCVRIEGKVKLNEKYIFLPEHHPFSMILFSYCALEKSTSYLISTSLFQSLLCLFVCFFWMVSSVEITSKLLLWWYAKFSCNCNWLFFYFTVTVHFWFQYWAIWKWQLSLMKENKVSTECAHYQTFALCNWMSWIRKDQYGTRPLPVQPHC